jgi:hypothetical protein
MAATEHTAWLRKQDEIRQKHELEELVRRRVS